MTEIVNLHVVDHAKQGQRGEEDESAVQQGEKHPQIFPDFNLDSPELYLNRELTWLEFNRRVLHEAKDERNPLLERLFFLAVVGSNLDEFFMKRIGGLKQQVGAGVSERSIDGRTAQQQIDACHEVVQEILKEQRKIEVVLHGTLGEQGISVILDSKKLTAAQHDLANAYFIRNVYPLLTPQGMDPAHPFPFLSNLSLNLLIEVRIPGEEQTHFNRLKIPIVSGGLPRFIQIGDENVYMPLENLVASNLAMLFPGMEIVSCEVFRITRNAITEKDQEQANDLLHAIESALRDRKFAEIVRLEVGRSMPDRQRRMLASNLGIDEFRDVSFVDGILAKRDIMEIAVLPWSHLHYPVHKAVDNADLAAGDESIFHSIRQRGSILVQHPYESFETSVERFLREASQDPRVLAIKMTLYRTAKVSRIIKRLIEAAQNEKQVAVVVELKARFDESANIKWANSLEKAGIHVTYGVVGLKTHSKLIFVVRRDDDGLRRYAHIGTGNYHSGTARAYCDLGLFTCDSDIGDDLTELFNYLTTGYSPIRHYKKLLPSPRILKNALLRKIDREITCHERTGNGCIQLKTNALEDRDIVKALYRASRAGVHIDLIVRDTCRLRPGILGLSENITVVSILGRFLEHARIYYFYNGGAEEYFIGSADLMKRNLESRVEVCTPVEIPRLQLLLRQILDIQIQNRRNCWEMQSDGHYVQRQPENENGELTTFDLLIAEAEKRVNSKDPLLPTKKGVV